MNIAASTKTVEQLHDETINIRTTVLDLVAKLNRTTLEK